MSQATPIRRRQFLTTAAGFGASALFLDACSDPPPPSISSSTRAVSPSSGTIHVIDVSTFPGTLQDAANAIGSGGILYFPEGSYAISSTISLRSNTWVMGSGYGSRLTRSAAISTIFNVDGKTGVRFSGLWLDFDVNFAGGCAIALSNAAGQCSNIAIEHCTFTAPANSGVRYALVADGARGLWFSDNRLEHADVIASVRSGGPGVYVTGNHLVSPHVGIACYATLGADVLEGVLIEDNLIEAPVQRAIHLGTQNEGVLVAGAKGIVVRNNIVRGAWGSGATGLLARFAQDSRDWIIEGNVFDPDTVTGNSIGMRFSSEHASAAIKSLAVLNNSVRNFDHQGIVIGGAASGVRISGNTLENTRGILLSSVHAGIGSAVIAENIVRGANIRVEANLADAGPTLVRNNLVMNTPGWESSGIRLVCAAGRSLRADVAGNRCSDDQPMKTQYFGAMEEGGGSFSTRYVNNDFSGNYAGAFGAVNAAAVLRNNLGAITEKTGVAVIGEGASSVTVAHGLTPQFPPAYSDISLTVISPPSSWIAANAGQVWIESPTGTNFVLRCSPPPQFGESLQVGWQASVRGVEV